MSQNFAPHVRAAAEEIRRRVPGVMSLSTYPDHGSGPNMGEPFAVDIQIAPWGQFANKHQEAAGDAIQKIIENPAEWQRLGVAYVIWWGWYSESPGVWTKYDPGNYNNPLASPDPESAYHMDHVHIQFLKNHVYRPPKADSGGAGVGNTGKDNPLWGIDISAYQAGIDLAQVRREGYEFCVVKASEGPSHDGWRYLNPEYGRQMEGAKAAGMVVGAYHFLLEGPAEPQVDLFLQTVGDVRGKILMVDFEDYPSWPSYTPSNAALKNFIAELRRRIGPDHAILLYSGQGFWEGGEPSGPVSAYGDGVVSWDAYYPLHPESGHGSALYGRVKDLGWGERWGGVEPMIWQFSANGLVAGLEVDVNAFRGSKAELLALTGSATDTGTPPPPPPAPKLKPNFVAVGKPDRTAAFMAASVCERRGFPATVTVERDGVRAFDQIFSREDLGTRQMIVVGKPALDALLPDSRQRVFNPYRPGESDYIGAVGKDLADTLRLLEGLLEAHVGKGASAEFRAIYEAGRGPGD